jgi:hypothetical protein
MTYNLDDPKSARSFFEDLRKVAIEQSRPQYEWLEDLEKEKQILELKQSILEGNYVYDPPMSPVKRKDTGRADTPFPSQAMVQVIINLQKENT